MCQHSAAFHHVCFDYLPAPSTADLAVPGGNCEVDLLFNDVDYQVPEFLSDQESMFQEGSLQNLFGQGGDAVGMDLEQPLVKVGGVLLNVCPQSAHDPSGGVVLGP